MSELHFLNVQQGDCTCIIHEATGNCTVFDICSGNIPSTTSIEAHLVRMRESPAVKGNFRMCKHPSNPIEFLTLLGESTVFRFILSHPDMDHLDGFNTLMNAKRVCNFWDSGARKEKPDFEGSPYEEIDWDRYVRVRDKREKVTVVTPRAGSRFQYANQDENGKGGGDGLYVLAPSKALVDEANESGDFNDASFVVLYRSVGGKILMPGDAHDKTWEYVLEHYEDDIRNCTVLIAPHHGRESGRSYEFLDVVNPTLTLFGCAPSEHLAYDAWKRRKLPKITNNQAGNISLHMNTDGMAVYVENDTFAEAVDGDTSIRNRLGYAFIAAISNPT